MTAYPRGQAGSTTAAEVNRVAKISAADLANPNPDVLTLLKLQVEIMDQLEVTDNAAWVIRLAQLPATVQKLFEAGTYNRIRYRHRVYGYDTRTLYAMLFAMMTNNKITRWYNIAASNAVAGELESVTEVLGGPALTQVSAVRKPALVSSVNSLPVAQFDGSDVWLQTLDTPGTGNNGTSKWWVAMRVRPADLSATQTLLGWTSAAGTAPNKLQATVINTTGQIMFTVFVSGFNGRLYLTAGGISALAYSHVYIQFDNTRTDEADTTGLITDAKVRMFIGNTAQAITPSDSGTGGVVAALLSSVGTACIGAANNTDAPAGPLRNGGIIGPNIMFGIEPLTADELANLVAFMVPT